LFPEDPEDGGIPVGEYLEHALALTPSEEAALAAVIRCLPPTIVDSHVHTSLMEHLRRPFGPKMLNHMMTTFPGYPIEVSRTIQRKVLAGVKVISVRFPHVYPEIDRQAANQYLLSEASAQDAIAAIGMVDNVPGTIKLIERTDVVALKMYYHDAMVDRPRIRDYFLPPFLEACSTVGKPIILHLPKPLPASLDDLLEVAESYAELSIILAHCGVVHISSEDYAKALEACSHLPNIVVDTARVEDAEVLALALAYLGADRVLFGSDEPLSLLRSRPYIHPRKGERLATDRLYHWSDRTEHEAYGHLAVGVHLSLIEQLAVLVAAIREICSEPETAIESVFFTNAVRVFKLNEHA
jgi:predicted TIM-barrel fold metal-dependent hydrolase